MGDTKTTKLETTKGEMTEMQTEQKSPQAATKRPRYKNTVHLWEFLLELLADERYSSMIAWSRKDYGEFKLKNQEEVARRWGIVKHRAGMNYEKLSRAIRYYYHQGIIQKVR
ncbi:protein FEV, partial [Exaiptasia diaphana]|uniref:ETS domain-containing protein n=1 Tax=Exaiptasia diaphana TaxID=2652724 RepID=A0A913XI88_EXADI